MGVDASSGLVHTAGVTRRQRALANLYLARRTLAHRQPAHGPFVDNAGIIGVGVGLKASSTPAGAGTIIIANFASGDAIQSHASVQHPLFRGLVITRLPAAVSGFGLNLNTICDFALLSDLWITGHVVGFNLSTTGYSKAEFIRCEGNADNGIKIVGQGMSVRTVRPALPSRPCLLVAIRPAKKRG